MLQLDLLFIQWLGGEANLRLLSDVFRQEQIGNGESGERTGSLERSPRTHKAVEGQMLVQTSFPLHHCSSGSTNSIPPRVLQPEPAPAPTGGPTTNSYINQPGTACASAGHGHHWTSQPRLVYWSPGNYCTLRQRPVPVDNPSRRTTRVHLPTSTAPFPSSLSVTLPPYPYVACHRRINLPHMRLRLQPAVLGNVSQLWFRTDAADPHPTHGRSFGVRSVATPPTAAFQPYQTPLRRPSVQS